MEIASKAVQGESFILELRLKCDSTHLGEVVRATGSVPELGNWAPGKGLLMKTNADQFPMWTCATLIRLSKELVDKGSIEYKYVIMRESDSTGERWEHFGGNRQVVVGTKARMLKIEDLLNNRTAVKEAALEWPPLRQTHSHLSHHLKVEAQSSVDPLSSSSPAYNGYSDEPHHNHHHHHHHDHDRQQEKVRQVANLVDKYSSLKKKPHLHTPT